MFFWRAGRLLELLGVVLGHLKASWGRLWGVLGRLGAPWVLLGGAFGSFWRRLEASWGDLGRLGGVLGGASRKHLGTRWSARSAGMQ